MRELGLLGLDAPVHWPWMSIRTGTGLVPHVSTTSFATVAARCGNQHEIRSVICLGLRLAGARSVAGVGRQCLRGARFPITSKLGSSPLGEGLLWRTGSAVRAAPRSRSVGQLGYFINAFKNSVLCHQCHAKLPTGALACLSSTVNTFGGGGGRGYAGKGGGGGGGGGDDGFQAAAGKGAAAVGGEQSDDVPVGPEGGDDVIILDVGGMSCGGCSASVKRILESQPQVSVANVNLATETAFVQVIRGSQSPPEWKTAKEEIGKGLAKHLSSCGFKSTVRETVV